MATCVINGRKAFITGAMGASVGIVMAKAEDVAAGGGARRGSLRKQENRQGWLVGWPRPGVEQQLAHRR